MSETKKGGGNLFAITIVIAGVAYLAMEQLSGFYSTQLREMSSVLAEFFLKLFSLPIQRMGTILETPSLRFDVVPACDGSTTLQVLMTLGVYWCGVHPRMSLKMKIIGTWLAIPVAIMINGLRVALLVASSHMLGEAVEEGMLHTAIGLVAFSLAMLIFFALTEWLAGEKQDQGQSEQIKIWALVVLLVVLYFPFLASCVSVWKGNPYDSFDQLGVLFSLGGGAWLAWEWKKYSLKLPEYKYSLWIFFISLSVAVLGAMLDIKYLLGISLLITLWTLAMMYRGVMFSIISIPLLGIIFLGYPKTTLHINFIMTKVSNFPAWNYGGLIIKIACLICFGLLFYVLSSKTWFQNKAPGTDRKIWALVAVVISVVIQSIIYSQAYNVVMASNIEMSYLQGKWEGHDLPIAESSLEYFEKHNIWSRRYQHDDSRKVDVLINASGGNRHRNHPPEYCMTGSGWKIIHSEKAEIKVGGRTMRSTQMRMERDGVTRIFVYWFDDGDESYSDYLTMMLADTGRRLSGKRTNWYLMRFFSDTKENILDFVEISHITIK